MKQVGSMKLFPSLLLALILVSGLQIRALAASAPGPGVGSALEVTVAPPKLPADGRSYAAVTVSLMDRLHNPSIALNLTTVYLYSSAESVVLVQKTVEIESGKSYAVANLTTTATPGTANITASSPGFLSSSSSVRTFVPSGFPTALGVFAAPNPQLTDPAGVGTLLIEILDQTGKPTRAVHDTEILIASSDSRIASPRIAKIVVPSGGTLSAVNYTSGLVTGSASITVSSSGFVSGAVSVSVVGTSPLELNLFGEPGSIAGSSTGKLVIALTDLSGNPARAPRDIEVSLTSSNTNAVIISSVKAIIQVGQIYKTVDFNTRVNGSSVITGSSPGLVSGFAGISVKSSSSGSATKLSLSLAPRKILADGGSYESVFVSLVDFSGTPVTASSPLNVILTSSNSVVGTVAGSLQILSGASLGSAIFSSTLFVGSTVITASAQNLQSDQATLSTFGPIPSSLLVSGSPSTLLADGRSYDSLQTMLLDKNGNPAIAPVDIVVQLESSRTDIAFTDPVAIIPKGRSYVLVPVTTSVSSGTSNITASSTGYASSWTLVHTVVPAPAKLALYLAPPELMVSNVNNRTRLFVQLQDSDGNPALAPRQIEITVTSSDSSLLRPALSLMIQTYSDFGAEDVGVMGAGSAVITGSAPGLESSGVISRSILLPLSVSISSDVQTFFTNQSANITAGIALFGSPLQKVPVEWTAKLGTVKPDNGTTTTGADGTVHIRFVPSGPGSDSVTATFTGQLFGRQSVTIKLAITQSAILPKPTSLPFIDYLALAGSASSLVLIVFFLLRRRRRKLTEKETRLELN